MAFLWLMASVCAQFTQEEKGLMRKILLASFPAQDSALLRAHLLHFSPSNTPYTAPPQGLCACTLPGMSAPLFAELTRLLLILQILAVNTPSESDPPSTMHGGTRYTQGIHGYIFQCDDLGSACLGPPYTVNPLTVSP